jgi:hypothetical protein
MYCAARERSVRKFRFPRRVAAGLRIKAATCESVVILMRNTDWLIAFPPFPLTSRIDARCPIFTATHAMNAMSNDFAAPSPATPHVCIARLVRVGLFERMLYGGGPL